jgi:hypothetical protein
MAEDTLATPRRQHGHSRAYILDRLRRENQTDFIDAIERGEISAHTAAIEMGWVKRPPSVAAVTHQARKRQLRLRAIVDGGHVTPAQWQELWLGPCGATSVFTSRKQLEDAWQRARERMIASLSPGRRPMGWWEFDAGDLKHPGYGSERSTLWGAGLLTDVERTTLEAEWKAEFATAQAPDFTLNDGSDELLTGDRARAAHYAHHDIPRELIRRWSAARRRRARQPPPAAPSEEEVAATE